MNKSNSIKNIASALLQAQKDLEPILLNATNPYFKSKYPDAGQVTEKVNKSLHKNDLVFFCMPGTQPSMDGTAVFSFLLTHSISGEWIESETVLPLGDNKNIAHAFGALMTYVIRRTNLSLMNVVGEEDDDANSLSKTNSVLERNNGHHVPRESKSEDFTERELTTNNSNIPKGVMIGTMLKQAAETAKPASPKQRLLLASLLHNVFPDDVVRQKVCTDIFDTSNWSKVSDEMVTASLNWMKPTKDLDGKRYTIPDTIYQELKRASAPYQIQTLRL